MKTSIGKAAAAMGRVKSAKKASASRENGKRGGRPKAYDELEMLIVAESIGSWNNVKPEHMPAMRSLSRKGLITDAKAKEWSSGAGKYIPSRGLSLTSDGEKRKKELEKD